MSNDDEIDTLSGPTTDPINDMLVLRQLRTRRSRNPMTRPPSFPPEEFLRVETIEHNGLRWINVVRPGNVEMSWLEENFKFNPLHLEDVTSHLQRPKIDDYEDYLFIVLHFPIYNRAEQATFPCEIDIFMGTDYIITVHEAELRPLNRLFEQCKHNPEKRQQVLGRTPSFALYRVVDLMVDYCFPIISKIAEKLDLIDEEIFKTSSSKTIYYISVLRRDIIAIRRIIKPQISILTSLERRKRTTDHEDMEAFFGDITDHIGKIWDSLEEFKDIIEGLSATYDSLATHRLNQIIKTLTVISVIMLPLTVLTGMYGMNVPLPFQEEKWSFVVVVGVMIAVVLGMLAFFRSRKWV